MSSSESDGEGQQQQQQQPQLLGSGKARAPNRHRFKRLAERIDDVDVDVYRRVGKVRSEPLPGATCFFQETIQEWRELNTTGHWLDVERVVRPWSQSLPLLLLHKQQVVDALLQGLLPAASPSLPPLFALLVAAARDLQEEMVPLLPAVWNRFTWILAPLPDGGGASNDPELLQALFNAAAGLCKVLVKHIAAALPAALKYTKDLRYHPEHHVRCLAAETFGFLLRTAPRKSLRAGMRALLAEHAVSPSQERAHGAGLLVAESVLGPEHGLHSKAASVLTLLLQEDLLTPADFGAAAADSKAADGKAADGKAAKVPKGLTTPALRVGGTAVAAVAFERLWQHTRRGSTQVLWQLLLEVNERRLAAVENAATAAGTAADSSTAATAAGASKAPARRQQQQQLAEAEQSTQQQQQSCNGQQDDQAVVVSTAAYGVLLLAQAVHYFRGSRVEDYGPLIKTVDRLVNLLQQSPAAAAPAPAGEQQPQQQLLQLQWRQQHGGEITWSVEDLDGLTLSHSTLQLILGVTLGHTKEVGASQGLGFIKGPCSHWSRVLGLASVPQQELVGFTQGLVMPPGNASITELFAPQLLGALGQLLLAAVGDDSGSGSNDKRKASAADCALAGLLEVCALLQPNAAFGSSSLPLLLTAHPSGADLAAAVAAMAAGCSSSVATIGSSDSSSSSSSSSSKQQLLQGWAALQLLPHAAVRLEQAVEVCSSVLTAATAAISHLQGAAGSSDSDVTVGELLQLRGMVLQMLVVLLPAVAPQQLPQLAADVLHWLLQQQQQQHGQPLDFATISSAAQVFEALRARVDQGMAGFSNSSDAAAADLASAQELLAVDKLPGVINITLTSLTVPQQELRAAALRLLCCFDQPSFTMPQQQQQDSDAKASHERAVFEGMRCDVLCVLRDMHTQPCSIQAGRTWSVALDRITNHLEYGRVPLLLQPAVVGGLLGVLHIRFSPLWQPAAKALGEALTQNPDVAWPIILSHLTVVQAHFLSGSSSSSDGHTSDDSSSGSSDRSIRGSNAFSLRQQWGSFCSHGRSSLAAAAAAAAEGQQNVPGCTDPANRMTNLLKGLAAQAAAGVLERTAKDWVPLLLQFAGAVTPVDLGGDVPVEADAEADAEAEADVEDDQAAAAAATGDAADAAAADTPSAAAAGGAESPAQDDTCGTEAAMGGPASNAAAAVPVGAKRKLESSTTQPQQQQQQQQHQHGHRSKRQRGGGGLGGALNRDGLGGLGFSVRAWRGVMMEWLSLLAASKAAKRVPRSGELQEAVARQLLSSDPSLQAAALKCLATFKLAFLPQPLHTFLLQLSDNTSLRSGLIHIPMMFDQSLTAEQQRQQQEQQQRQATKASSKKGNKGQEVGRVDDSIRPGFVPLLTLVLYPKMSKRSGRLGGKGAPGSARAAVLNALAALHPPELIPLLELLLLPISGCFTVPQPSDSSNSTPTAAAAGAAAAGAVAAGAVAEMDACRLIPAPWWSKHLVNGDLSWWLSAVDRSKLAAQPLRRRQGFLNAFEDLLGHLGFRVQALLPPLMAITLHLLEQACSSLQQAQDGEQGPAAAVAAAGGGGEGREEGRALRSQTLRLFAQIFARFPNAVDFNPLWPGFFAAVNPLMQRLVPEAVAAVAPPLLAATAALAAAPGLARVLGNLPSQQQQQQGEGGDESDPSSVQVDTSAAAAPAAADGGPTAAWPEGLGPKPTWAAQGLGAQLLSSCFAVLSAKRCSEGTRDVALTVAESCIALQDSGLLSSVLLPHTSQLLGELRVSIEGVLAAAAAASARARGGPRGGKGSSHSRSPKPSVMRQLALLEQISPWCSDAATASSLAQALVALLQPPRAGKSGGSSAARAGGHGGFKRAPLDERGLARALGALAAIWKALLTQQQPLDALLQHWEVVCLLLGHLSRRESRSATAAALAALGALIDSSSSSTAGSVSFVDVASMVVSLNSWAVTSLDEPDYNARLGCYSQLQPPAWQAFSRLQALPLTLQAYYDLRNDSDLALRQAAATALTKGVRAFAALDSPQQQQQQQDGEAADPAQPQPQQPQQQQQQSEDLLRLVPRVMYPQTKVGLRSNNLSVRQEHAALLRELVLLLPQRFTDLVPLCNQDAEQDFFLNITHLQIHRRGRALALLVRLMSQQQPQQQPQQQQGSEQAAAAAAEASDGAARKKRKVQDSSTQQQQDGKAGDSAAPAAAAEGDSDAAVAVGDKRPRQQQQHKPVSARVLLDIAAPLIQQFIFDGSSNTSSNSAAADAAAEAQRGGHGKKKGDADREGAVANVAIDALKGLAGQLGWEQYSGLLQRWLKLMTQYPRKQIIRAACAVLDAFHFPVEDPAAAEDHQQQQQQQGSKQQQRGSKEAGTAAALAAAAATAAAAGDAAEVEQVDLEVEEADDDVIIVEEEDEQAAAAAMAATAAADAADIAASARVLLQSKVLPVLQSQVVVDDQEVARAPVALAIVKLIKLLPRDVERVALPRVLTSIAGLLRSRLHSSRDAAREVLADVSLELGPEYLTNILHVLRSVLPDKGYTAHVLGYTAAALLEAHIKAGVAPGQLDDCVEPLLPTLEGDLFGEVAAAKDVAAFAGKYKEAKRCRAYEAFQHLAAAVTFSSSSRAGSAFDQLLQLVRDKLPAAGSPSIRAKLEQLLTAAARGLAQNPSVTAPALAAWIGVQLDVCLRVEEAARAKAQGPVSAAVSSAAAGRKSAAPAAAAETADEDEAAAAAAAAGSGGDGDAHLYLLSHFCVNVLSSSLKKGLLSGRSPEVLLLLDPLLPLLVRGLASRHMGTVQACLKCLAVCVSLQHLPGLPAAAVSAGKAVSSLLRKVPDAAHPLAQDCFKLLGAMLRDCPSYEPPTHHIRFLLKWIAADLQAPAGTSASAAAARVGATGGGSSGSSAGERVSGYSLLRAVLGRKLMLPEVYDVMDIVQKQMITSHLPPVRATASAALLQFLLDYPLSPSRLQGHMVFLLTNTGYKHEEGRLQALDMLQQVFLKFPPAVVANLSTTAYMPLITRLANETSPKARTATAATLKLLHKQLQADSNDALAALSQQWLVNSTGGQQQQQKLRGVAAQALGILAEVEGARFSRRLGQDFVQGLVQQLTAAAAAAEDVLLSRAAAAGDEGQEGDAVQGLEQDGVQWQEVYHVLLMLEKAAQGGLQPLQWQQGPAVQQLWLCVVQELLLYPHLWVRKAAVRLLGLALSNPGVYSGLLQVSSSAGAAAAGGAAAAAAANGAQATGSSNASSSGGMSEGRCALLVYLQLEADVVDEGLCTQAVKCLVALAKQLAAAQPANQAQPSGHKQPAASAAADAAGNGAVAGDSSSEGEEEEEEDSAGDSDDEAAAGAAAAAAVEADEQEPGIKDGQLTLLGLITRMVRLAEDTRYVRQQQRMAALRWIAAVVSAAGTAPLLPHLPLLLRPLYRIAEATGEQKIHAQALKGSGGGSTAGNTPEDVVVLSDQVMAHLRNQFGAETLLSAYATAREEVRASRAARKTAAARKALLDPEAAARLKLRRGKKKGEARQRKAEERRRSRSARGSGGFGYKAAKGPKRSAKSHKLAQKSG